MSETNGRAARHGALLVLVLALAACSEPRALGPEKEDAPWAAEHVVCWPGAASACEDAVWSTWCEPGGLVEVPTRRCVTPDGPRARLRYSAERVEAPEACDVEGRLLASWEALAEGLAQSGCR